MLIVRVFIKSRLNECKMNSVLLICFFYLSCFTVIAQSVDTGQISYNRMSGNELEEKGREFLKKDNLSEALICFKLSTEKFQTAKNDSKAGELLLEQGFIYLKINDFENAMSTFVQARDIYEEKSDYKGLSIVSLEIGELFGKLSQCDNAFKNLFQSIRFQNKIKPKDDQLKLRTNLDLGIVYGSCSDLDSALYYFELSLKLFSDSVTISYCGLLNNIGAIYSKKNENLKALEYYDRALILFKKQRNELGVAVTESNIAYIFKKQKRFDESIPLYLKAINYFDSVKSYLYLRDNLLNLSEVYEIQGDYKSALKYTNKYLEINEKVANSDILGKMNDLQMQHDIRKKENELELLEKENEVANIRLYMMIGGFLMLIIIVLLVFRTMRTNLKNTKLKQEMLRQEKIQLNKDIELKNKDLEVFAMKVIEKNEFLEKLKIDLKNVSSDNMETNSRIREISAVIHSNLNADKDRREFEMQLDEAHKSFFAKLHNLHIDLTEYEKRLCSLLVLELKTKDIAVILNISPDSVKKSRYRLRKKLNLETDDNLVQYLMNL